MNIAFRIWQQEQNHNIFILYNMIPRKYTKPIYQWKLGNLLIPVFINRLVTNIRLKESEIVIETINDIGTRT